MKSGSVTIRLLAVAVLTTLVLASSVTTAQSGTCWRYRRAERVMTRKLNRARIRHGMPRFQLDRHISRVSRAHTYSMVRQRQIFHTPAGTLARRVTRWITLGENVGRTPRGVRSLYRSFMRSASHRGNILNSAFTYVGVGTVRRGGRLWMTLTFEARRDPGTTLSMPSC